MTGIEAVPGNYVLVLAAAGSETADIGKLATIVTQKGYYLYTGSAFGPGGIQARINRHVKQVKPRRWHIDYLSEQLLLTEVWFCEAESNIECRMFDVLAGMGGEQHCKGFGASDCCCPSHLLYFERVPDLEYLAKQLNLEIHREILSPVDP